MGIENIENLMPEGTEIVTDPAEQELANQVKTSPDVTITEDPGPAPEETEQSDDGSAPEAIEGDPDSSDAAVEAVDPLSE